MKWDDLSDGQKKAAELTCHLAVATGGAGAGKTTAALWAARAHLLRATSSERVLFVTFSRTAVGLIARRSREAWNDFRDRIEVHTFHSLSYRILSTFGRYAGFGTRTPAIESEARAKLLGRDGSRLSYDDLIPIALRLLEAPRIAELVQARWTLVVCDEFQDTGSDQWELLQKLSRRGRLLLFADPHQMIHSWRPTVSEKRLDEALDQADDCVELEEASYRDPSGVVPAMAARVRERDFGHPAIRMAVESGRLRLRTCGGDEVPSLVRAEIVDARRSGARSVGVFETTNQGVAELGAELTDLGVRHTLIGIPEAQGEGLLALAQLLSYGLGATPYPDAQLQLAVFLTAAVRSGSYPPRLAVEMRDDCVSSPPLQERFRQLRKDLTSAVSPDEVLDIATTAWSRLGIAAGMEVWQRAARGFAALVRRILALDLPPTLLADEALLATRALQTEALITGDSPDIGAVQLMNFHQTKGREADAVVLVYREGGFVAHWSEVEPFAEKSRLLYVGLTRARTRATILLPPDPHALVAPFERFL